MTTHHNDTGHSTQQTTTMPDTPDSKNSPTGNQQDLPQVPVGIDHADARPVSSEGNQAIAEAAEQIDPAALAANLKSTTSDAAAADSATKNTAPFASYATGKVPDTE